MPLGTRNNNRCNIIVLLQKVAGLFQQLKIQDSPRNKFQLFSIPQFLPRDGYYTTLAERREYAAEVRKTGPMLNLFLLKSVKK